MTVVAIEAPHVPYGPQGLPAMIADADYLEHAASNLERGFPVGGSNVTATVVTLLRSVSSAMREEQGKHWCACAINAPREELRGPCDCETRRAAPNSD